MKRMKPVYISILTIVVFAAALIIGMQSDWWILDGRKTPLDGVTNTHSDENEEMTTDEEYIEEDHDTTQISGGSTVQNAINLGISLDEIEEVLGGTIENFDVLIKDIVTERGLKFGEVKDTLNGLIND